MAGPMKMRATLGSGYTDVRVLMTHPMTTAQSNQPLHFIQNITVKQNGKAVVEAQISQAISRNPVFTFFTNELQLCANRCFEGAHGGTGGNNVVRVDRFVAGGTCGHGALTHQRTRHSYCPFPTVGGGRAAPVATPA